MPLQHSVEEVCMPKTTGLRKSKFTSWHPLCGSFCHWLATPPRAYGEDLLAVTHLPSDIASGIGASVAVEFARCNNRGGSAAVAAEPPHNSGSGHRTIDKLPVELWAEIFYICLPTQTFITPDPLQAPLLLCQICRSWRAIATGTPLLWSALAIRGSWCLCVWKSSLESWLRRAGNAVLSLDIAVPLYMEPIFTRHIMRLVTGAADRWYHLRLGLTNPLLCVLLDREMPALRTLEFSSLHPLSSLSMKDSQVPSLKNVSLLSKSLYIQPLCLPWTQLTSLSSQCWLNIPQHLDILTRCPALEIYSMRIIDAEVGRDFSTILRHDMRILEIIPFMGSALGPVLDYFHLPNLVQLSFVIPDGSPSQYRTTWTNTHLLRLYERSSFPLAKLRLKGATAPDECISALQKVIHTLVLVECQ